MIPKRGWHHRCHHQQPISTYKWKKWMNGSKFEMENERKNSFSCFWGRNFFWTWVLLGIKKFPASRVKRRRRIWWTPTSTECEGTSKNGVKRSSNNQGILRRFFRSLAGAKGFFQHGFIHTLLSWRTGGEFGTKDLRWPWQARDKEALFWYSINHM